MTTRTSTEYDAAYEKHLRHALGEWADKHAFDKDSALDTFLEYARHNGFVEAIGWKAEDVISAQVYTSAAVVVRRALAEGTASEALEKVEKFLLRTLQDGVQKSSTSEFTNLAEKKRGVAAMMLSRVGPYRPIDSPSNFTYFAYWEATRELATSEYEAVSAATKKRNTASGKVSRARTDDGERRARLFLQEAEAELGRAEVAVRARLSEVGAPLEAPSI